MTCDKCGGKLDDRGRGHATACDNNLFRYGGKRTKIPARPSEPVRAYYKMSSTNDIYWDFVDRIEAGAAYDGGDELFFTDGGHCPVSSCYFSEEQCRAAHGLLDRDAQRVIREAAESLETAVARLDSLRQELLALDPEKQG